MTGPRDPWIRLTPAQPPAALRARVLAAAREVQTRPEEDLLAALFRDRLLRLCAATVATLLVVDLLVVGGGRATGSGAAPAFADVDDGVVVPVSDGLTAADQRDALAPMLGLPSPRSRG